MPLSTSTLFADRTMLRSIFMALEDMALFSDACLFFKHVCNFLPIEVLIVIKLLVIMMV